MGGYTKGCELRGYQLVTDRAASQRAGVHVWRQHYAVLVSNKAQGAACFMLGSVCLS
jgi:hypothetical protein